MQHPKMSNQSSTARSKTDALTKTGQLGERKQAGRRIAKEDQAFDSFLQATETSGGRKTEGPAGQMEVQEQAFDYFLRATQVSVELQQALWNASLVGCRGLVHAQLDACRDLVNWWHLSRGHGSEPSGAGAQTRRHS